MHSATPLVSIVTPSFNQRPYLEATLLSVARQSYAPLEHWVMDGGSSDGSIEVIRLHEARLAGWVSESDRGQAHAVNKGLYRARGEILGWLNSDDTYLPDAVEQVVRCFNACPDVDVVYGNCDYIDASGAWIRAFTVEPFDRDRLVQIHDYIPQPATFFRRRVLDRIGVLDESLHYVLDYEYWLRAAHAGFRFRYLPVALATYRLCEGSKTVSHARWKARWEEWRVTRRHGRRFWRWCLGYWIPDMARFRYHKLRAALSAGKQKP